MAEILVFEDNTDAQVGITRILNKAGHHLFGEFVACYGDIDTAIAKAVEAGVKVAIVDGALIDGDDSDGIEIVEKLRRARIQSIAHATYHNDEMGADFVVGKGGSQAVLLNAIAQALGSSV